MPALWSPKSIIKEPINSGLYGDLIINIASVADDMPSWGSLSAERDRKLRAFWPTEPILASALYTTASRYAALGWSLEGPPRTVSNVRRMLHGVEFGEGWIRLQQKTLIDLFSQDNGAFIEVVRTGDSETAPVISLNHLDASRCIRTGKRIAPVSYIDNVGSIHELKWYQVICLTEFPSPAEVMRGMQYCALTRLLRAAQIMRDITTYKKEKVSGRFTRAIHLVGGIQQKVIQDALASQNLYAESQGMTRYIQPVVIASLDPTASVTHATLELASLPDGFDEEVAMKWYINQLALAFGTDYQDYAPLPGGNLGTAQQSETLHLKSKGKGPKLYMSLIEHIFNFQGILPSTVTFTFGDQDIAEDMQNAELRYRRAQERAARIESGEITTAVARQLAADVGDLSEDYLAVLNETNITEKITVSS